MSEFSLDRVQIDGFRGLRNLDLQDLGRINILVGENNSGKTSALEAISILCNPFIPDEWMALVRRRDFGGLDETRVQSLRWCFHQSGVLVDPDVRFEGQCEMSSEGQFELDRLVATYRDIEGEPDERQLERWRKQRGRYVDELELDEAWLGAEVVHHVEMAGSQAQLFDLPGEPVGVQFWEKDRMVRRPRPGKAHIKCETLTPYMYQVNQYQVRSQSRHFFSDKKNSVDTRATLLELLRDFDEDIEDIDIASLRGDRPSIYVNHRRLGAMPLSAFGDAVRRIVLMASTLPQLARGGVLLVDEVETGIHVNALQKVFSWLMRSASQLGIQVIATTHSLEAIDAVASACTEGEEIITYHLEQKVDQTRAKRIACDMLIRLRHERGLDVR